MYSALFLRVQRFHKLSLFPVRFEREDVINIAMSSLNFSIRNGVDKFSLLVRFSFYMQLNFES